MSQLAKQIAAIRYERGFDIDQLLIDVSSELARLGFRLGGLLQLSTGDKGGSCATSVNVIDLRAGTAFDIWQDRGPCARGCRLDEGGLAEAERVLHAAIEDAVDLLIVNRFGRAESLGRGLRSCIERAVAAGIPVLTAVRAPYDQGWAEFHCGLGCELSPTAAIVSRWAHQILPAPPCISKLTQQLDASPSGPQAQPMADRDAW